MPLTSPPACGDNAIGEVLHLMNMKRFLSGTLVLGLMAMPAMAGSILTPMQGTLGDPFNNGQVHGYGWNAAASGGLAGPNIGNLYDNILTINGGAVTAGFFGPFDDIPGTQAFVDWVGSAGQWSDDLHEISAGGVGPAVVTSLRYGYSNTVATTTHVIKIYDMVPPSIVPSSTVFDKGSLLASIVLPANPTGAFMVTVTGLNIQIPQSAVWIKFVEAGPGFPGTFWLSGGAGNGVGLTHPGVAYSYKFPNGGAYNFFFAFPYFYFDGTGYVASNIQVALSGFHVPAPAVMSLLGLGGLVTLRRRRSR